MTTVSLTPVDPQPPRLPASRPDPVRREDLTWVLTLEGWDATVAAGSGVQRIQVREIEVSFSGDDVRWQVSIEGKMDLTRASTPAQAVADCLAIRSAGGRHGSVSRSSGTAVKYSSPTN